jgi:hypothetical protein
MQKKQDIFINFGVCNGILVKMNENRHQHPPISHCLSSGGAKYQHHQYGISIFFLRGMVVNSISTDIDIVLWAMKAEPVAFGRRDVLNCTCAE